MDLSKIHIIKIGQFSYCSGQGTIIVLCQKLIDAFQSVPNVLKNRPVSFLKSKIQQENQSNINQLLFILSFENPRFLDPLSLKHRLMKNHGRFANQ